jgi:dTDP-4-dehydrorhamnose reductase
MLGSAVMRDEFYGTTRSDSSESSNVLPSVDITRLDDLQKAFDWADPDVVINCAGIVKSECDKNAPSRVISVNSVAPHVIAMLAAQRVCRVIHVSTDCVFDGTRGSRTESDAPDATDLYGQSKAAGELLDYEHCVTLRTSFIGRDRSRGRGLLEWLLAQKNETIGYTRALWSGLSDHELARVIVDIVSTNTNLRGLYHVSGPIISKADLLRILIGAYASPCQVLNVDEPKIDRTLDGSKFKEATGYVAPTWTAMAEELAL